MSFTDYSTTISIFKNNNAIFLQQKEINFLEIVIEKNKTITIMQTIPCRLVPRYPLSFKSLLYKVMMITHGSEEAKLP